MDTLNEYLSTKAEHLASSLYNYMLRSKRRRNSNNNNNNGYYYYYNNRYHGLETLIHSEENKLPCTILHCYNISKTKTPSTSKNLIQYSSRLQRLSKSMWSSSPGSPAVRSTVMGDLIGTESGDCMSWDIFEKVGGESESESESESQRRCCRVRKREKKEYPPAITLLRENRGMPLVFKKECGKDGRLILKTERVYYEGYSVQAHRDNGRVIMTLIHHDHVDDDNEEEEVEESGLEFEKEMAEENCETGLGLGLCGDLRHCVSYAGTGFLRDFESFYLGRPGSLPLRPMTSVM